jgi:hypothetical protein
MLVRAITSHKVNGLNDALSIVAIGDAGPGGANLHYKVSPPELNTFDATRDPARASRLMRACCDIRFQDGNPADGVNGISNETLLAIVEDRLTGFQSGQFATRECAVALTKIQEAMMWLHKRTRDRAARGVEGTLER